MIATDTVKTMPNSRKIVTMAGPLLARSVPRLSSPDQLPGLTAQPAMV
jgi:hypothetical protein